MEAGREFPLAVHALVAAVILADVTGIAVRSVPLSVLGLGALLLVSATPGRPALRAPSRSQTAFLAALCLGLVSLEAANLGAGLKELAQAGIVFGAGVTVFTSLTRQSRRVAGLVLAVLCPGLMAWALLLPGQAASARLSDARFSLLLALSLPFFVHSLAAIRDRGRIVLIAAACLLYTVCTRHGGLFIAGLLGALGVLVLTPRRGSWRPISLTVLAVAAGILLAGPGSWEVLQPHHRAGGALKRLYVEYEAVPGAVSAAPLTGHGLGRYRHAIKRFFVRLPDPADNRVAPDTNSTYAVLAVEAGIPAVLLLLTMMAAIVWQGARNVRREPDTIPALCAVLTLLIAGFFTVVPTRNTGLAVAAVLGLCAGPEPVLPASRAVCVRRLGFVALCLACGIAASVLDLGSTRLRLTGRLTPVVMVPGPADLRPECWVLEAEDGAFSDTVNMFPAAANDASAGMALTIPDKARKGHGEMAMSLSAPPGTYSLWVRAFWRDGCRNSVGCTIADRTAVLTDEIYNRWHWVLCLQRIDITEAGTQVHLRTTEPGVMIDQILLTPSPTFVPQGIMKNPHRQPGQEQADIPNSGTRSPE